MEKKDMSNSILKLANDIMKEHNMKEAAARMKSSYGIALYDNGLMLKVLKNFDYVSENWKLLQQARAMADKTLAITVLTENTDGGLIDTGDIILDINRICAMYPVHRLNDELHEEENDLFDKSLDLDMYIHGGGKLEMEEGPEDDDEE